PGSCSSPIKGALLNTKHPRGEPCDTTSSLQGTRAETQSPTGVPSYPSRGPLQLQQGRPFGTRGEPCWHRRGALLRQQERPLEVRVAVGGVHRVHRVHRRAARPTGAPYSCSSPIRGALLNTKHPRGEPC